VTYEALLSVWRRLLPIAAALLAGCATPYFDVDEAIRFEDGRTRFVGFAQEKKGWFLGGVSDVEVRFSVDGREVARGVTDERGFVKAIVDVEQPSSRFEATADVEGEVFRADADIVAWRSDRVIVGCDIDSTISQTSVRALFFDEIDETSTPIPDSPEVLTEIGRDHQLMYITARPRFTLDKTHVWLDEHGYPDQPVVTSLATGDAFGQTAYKTMTLNSLRKHYTNLLIGIGNTDIDAESYTAHGMLVLLIQPKLPMGRTENVFHFQDWQQVRAFFVENRAALRDPERVRAAIRGEEELRLPTLQ
jgi:hypothetical protein